MDAKQRLSIRAELTAKGYALDYLDNWQPKVQMWWHRDQLNVNGSVVYPAGTPLPNQPGHPDHQVRLSRRGILPWPPSDICKCKGCRDRRAPTTVEAAVPAPTTEGTPKPVEAKTHIIHKFASNDLGAPCTIAGCGATRQRIATNIRHRRKS